VFESGAILLYLAQKTGRFLPKDARRQVATLEWLMWQMGGFGPMPGQVHHFLGVKDPQDQRYGLERYRKETLRLYGVMDRHLAPMTGLPMKCRWLISPSWAGSGAMNGIRWICATFQRCNDGTSR